ncbi:hypothetical protein D3C85_1443660 [compost metagenome]
MLLSRLRQGNGNIDDLLEKALPILTIGGRVQAQCFTYNIQVKGQDEGEARPVEQLAQRQHCLGDRGRVGAVKVIDEHHDACALEVST